MIFSFDVRRSVRAGSAALQAFRATDNESWTLGRWRHRAPAAVRDEHDTRLQVAA